MSMDPDYAQRNRSQPGSRTASRPASIEMSIAEDSEGEEGRDNKAFSKGDSDIPVFDEPDTNA